jgi:hypothetical protein
MRNVPHSPSDPRSKKEPRDTSRKKVIPCGVVCGEHPSHLADRSLAMHPPPSVFCPRAALREVCMLQRMHKYSAVLANASCCRERKPPSTFEPGESNFPLTPPAKAKTPTRNGKGTSIPMTAPHTVCCPAHICVLQSHHSFVDWQSSTTTDATTFCPAMHVSSCRDHGSVKDGQCVRNNSEPPVQAPPTTRSRANREL